MKQILIITILSVAAIFHACRPDDYKEVGTPGDRVALLEGTWKVTRVVQQDVDAIQEGFPYKELDVTDVAPFTSSTLRLTLNDGQPATFSANRGTAPFFLPATSGAWSVDNVSTPGEITLGTGASAVTVQLGSYVLLGGNKMQFTISRKQGDATVMAYVYELTKQ